MRRPFVKTLLGLLLSLATAAACAIDINDADQASMETIKGIGPKLSEAILAERRKGAFEDWRDLLRRVKGIGPASAARLSADGLTVNGKAFEPGGR